MRTRTALAAMVCLLLAARPVSAHRLDECLQATILSLQADHLQASMRLIPGVAVAPAMIAAMDSNGDGALSATEQQSFAQHILLDLAITVDGKSVGPQLISWDFPQPAEMLQGMGEIHITYAVPLPQSGAAHRLIIATRHASTETVYLFNAEVPSDPGSRITAQKRNAQQSVYELDYQQSGGAGDKTARTRLGLWSNSVAFSSLFHLGMRHIADGTDHLLFLITLLLPAPLVVCGSRWGGPSTVSRSLLRVLSIVTAFTIGHSITLMLAAVGSVHVPARPVEVLIAVSILVSALHALRPWLPGKEAYIALFFGLIHGLAFAATLDRLGLDRWERFGGILAFNLGIETMQMVVVAAILPSLILLSRTRAYPLLRIGGALMAAIASLAWILQRLFGMSTPVDTIVTTFARHAVWLAVTLFAVSLACRLSYGLHHESLSGVLSGTLPARRHPASPDLSAPPY